MKSLQLNICGEPIRIWTADASRTQHQIALDELRQDFDGFPTEPHNAKSRLDPQILDIQLLVDRPEMDTSYWKAFRFRDALCRGWAARRQVYYDDGSVVRFDSQTQTAQVWAPDAMRLREITYLLILSKAGEALDRRGIHRFHALGVQIPLLNATAMFLCDSGVGKSTLALGLSKKLGTQAIRYFADDVVLSDGKRLIPFPVRVALTRETQNRFGIPDSLVRLFKRKLFSEKSLMPLEALGTIAEPAPVTALIFCSRDPSLHSPQIRPASRFRAALGLLRFCVVGIGVPQMTEHFLRFETRHMVTLIRIAISRIRVCAELYRRSHQVIEFTLTQDVDLNVRELLSHFARSSGNQEPLPAFVPDPCEKPPAIAGMNQENHRWDERAPVL